MICQDLEDFTVLFEISDIRMGVSTGINLSQRRTPMARVQNISALKDALKTNWKLFLFQGIVMVIFGILAVAWPVVATIAVDLYVGWLFLITGMVGLCGYLFGA